MGVVSWSFNAFFNEVVVMVIYFFAAFFVDFKGG